MKTLKVKCNFAELDRIRNFLKKTLAGLKLSDEEYFQIELPLLEICVNIVRYAYPCDKGMIYMKIWQEERKVFLEIKDNGTPFDPRESKDPDIQEIIGGRNKGGFGIFLSRKFMDGFDYKRENGQNVLTMYKKIKESGTL